MIWDVTNVSLTAGFRLFAVVGPTAAGKSALALALARQIGAEILSVDSMQVYRHMDIGTAKPSATEQSEIPHHLIDVALPTESFAVARFVELADQVIENARSRQVPLIAVGGTPLYFKALFQGLFDGPAGDEALRQNLSQIDPEELHARLTKIDPETALRLHVNDTRRVIRALEVFEITGSPISTLQTQWAGLPRHDGTWLGVTAEKEILSRRINARVKQMIDAGWVDEVRQLQERFITLSPTAGEATGYAHLARHVRGELSLTDAIEEIKILTRQLARKQTKWFRRFENVTWYSSENDAESVARSLALWS